ncbi:MAG: hypothetical protein GQ581_02870 [Methyloprofundus sp.]|nr:hypothetical protein [Methyloprofundus sp.]
MISLTGCFYWWRAYQTYLQMGEFDDNFAISITENFSVQFKDPVLFADDIVTLAKLRPSKEIDVPTGQQWQYVFRKVDQEGNILLPETKFYCQLDINHDDKVTGLSFSALFLQIAPPEFLELSFRSLGSGKIDKVNRRLKVDTDKINKITADLPLKSAVLAQLGEPLFIEETIEQEVYVYHFKLEAYAIKKGYEDRTLSVVKLSFAKNTGEMTRMAGRFAGLKISINYKNYQTE